MTSIANGNKGSVQTERMSYNFALDTFAESVIMCLPIY